MGADLSTTVGGCGQCSAGRKPGFPVANLEADNKKAKVEPPPNGRRASQKKGASELISSPKGRNSPKDKRENKSGRRPARSQSVPPRAQSANIVGKKHVQPSPKIQKLMRSLSIDASNSNLAADGNPMQPFSYTGGPPPSKKKADPSSPSNGDASTDGQAAPPPAANIAATRNIAEEAAARARARSASKDGKESEAAGEKKAEKADSPKPQKSGRDTSKTPREKKTGLPQPKKASGGATPAKGRSPTPLKSNKK